MKSWPFIRPLLNHFVILFGTGGLATLVLFLVGLVGTDLFNNKILVGDKLQPLQATALFVDESYVARDITDNVNERDVLSLEQRKVVRNRSLLWAAGLTAVFLPIAVVLVYYNLWIWQMLNQNLRVALMAKAEHLSLRFHSRSPVGDAIFRVYQDSATITRDPCCPHGCRVHGVHRRATGGHRYRARPFRQHLVRRAATAPVHRPRGSCAMRGY